MTSWWALQIPKASRREKNEGLPADKAPAFGNDTGDGLGRGISNTRQDLLHGNNHPTVKPVKLFAFLLSMFCPEGGVVLDPFCGSGTTGVAAKQQGFEFIGVELNPEYAEIARARIDGVKQEKQLALASVVNA